MNISKNMKLVIAGILAILVACGIGFSDKIFKSNAAIDLKELSTLNNAVEVNDSTTIPSDYTFYPDIQKKSDGTQITNAEAFGSWDYKNTDTVEDGTEQPLKGIANIVWIDKGDHSYDGKIGMYYDNVGTYNGKTVALRATYMGNSDKATNNGFALIMYNNKLGIRTSLSHDAVTIKYEFLDAETGKAMNVKGYQQFADIDYYQGLKIDNYDKLYYAHAALDALKVVNYDGIGQVIQSTISDNLIDDPTNKAKISYTFSGTEIQYTWTSSIRYYRDVQGQSIATAKAYKNLDKEASIIQALNTYYYVDASGNICASDTENATRKTAILTINASSDKIVPSEMKKPIKIVSDKNGDDITQDTYTSTDKIYFTVIHEVPGETSDHYYTSYKISDALIDVLNTSVADIKVLDGGTKEDVSYKFDITFENNTVVASAKADELAKADFYAKSYELVIGTSVKDGADLTNYTNNDIATIPNKATVNVNSQTKNSDEITVKVKDNPVLTIEKTSDKTSYDIGDVANYTVKVSQNVKGATAKNVTIKDTIKNANAELIAKSIVVTDSNNNIVDQAQVLVDGNSYTIKTNQNLAYGQFLTVSYRVNLTSQDLAGKEVVNTATASATNADDVDATNTINVAVPVVYTPVLHIEKSANVNTVSVGDKIAYTIKVSQSEENAVAKNVAVSDVFDTNLITLPSAKDIKVKDMDGNTISDANVSVNATGFTVKTTRNLAKDEFITITYTATAGNEELANTTINNTANAVADNATQVSANASVIVKTPVLVIEKTTNKEFFSLGDKITYTVKVTQTQSDVSAKNIVVKDAFDTNLMSFPSAKNIKVKDMNGDTLNDAEITVNGNNLTIATHADLATNEFLTVSYTISINNATVIGTDITNTATASADHTQEVSDQAVIKSSRPILAIEKTADKEYFTNGDKVVYSIRVSQTTENAVASDIIIKDSFDKSVSMPAVKNIKVKDMNDAIINDAEINVDGKNITIDTHMDLAKDEFITVEYPIQIADSKLIGSDITNTAKASAVNADEVQDQAVIKSVVPVLTIDKGIDMPMPNDIDSAQNFFELGKEIPYRLVVKQTSENALATNVVITDTFDTDLITLPSVKNIKIVDTNGKELSDAEITIKDQGFVIKTNANLAQNETFVVTYTAVANDEKLVGKNINNVATVKSDTTEPVQDEKQISIVKPVLTIEKTSDKEVYELGETAVYNLKVMQTAENVVARNVVITDKFDNKNVVPENIIVTNMNGDQIEANVEVKDNGFTIATNENLAKDEFINVSYSVAMTNEALANTTIKNTAVVKSDNADEKTTEKTVEIVKAELEVNKTSDAKYYSLGDTATYTLTVRQTKSHATARNVVIEDTFDQLGLTPKNVTIFDKDNNPVDGADITVNANGITIYTHHDLAEDEYFKITYTVLLNNEELLQKDIKNTVIVRSDNTDADESTNTIVYNKPQLSTEKVSGKKYYSLGDTVSYTIKTTQLVENTIAKNVVITDTFDTNLITLPEAKDITITDTNGNVVDGAEINVTETGFVINTHANLGKDEFFTVTYSVVANNENLSSMEVKNTVISSSDNTNPSEDQVTVNIEKPELVIDKKSDKKTYGTDEVAKYTIVVKQPAKNAVAKQVVLKDVFDNKNAMIDQDTIKITDKDGNILPNAEINLTDEGLVINTHVDLATDEFLTLTYSVKMTDKLAGQTIKNTVYGKADNSNENSATNEIKMVAPVLKIEKSSDQPIYLIGSTAKYTVKVSQTTENAIAKNVSITDALQNASAKFLPDTVKVVDKDGKELSNIEITKATNGYQIATHKDLAYGESITITYNVELKDTSLIQKEVSNTASASGDNVAGVQTICKVKVSDNVQEVKSELKKAGIDPSKVETQTGDRTPIIPIACVAILSIVGIVVVLIRKRH